MADQKNSAMLSELEISALVVDETPAIIGYIDSNLIYRFANQAYLEWFGKTREQVMHIPMIDVLGPVYHANLVHTMAALDGCLQVFERKFSLPDGTPRYGLITYKPHFNEDKVLGFYVLVADVSVLKKVEFELLTAKEEIEASAARELKSLNQANETLKHIGVIGQEITAHLNYRSICVALNTHTCELLDAKSCKIYLFEKQKQQLSLVHNDMDNKTEMGRPIPLSDVDPEHKRAAIQGSTIFIDPLSSVGNGKNQVPDLPVAIMIGAMLVGDNVVGIMEIKAYQSNRITEREQLIFRALCTYGAIAFDNAQAYRKLQNTQLQIIEQAKMTALGSMAVGVSHKLNTPIGNCQMISSIMDSKTAIIAEKIQTDALTRSELKSYLDGSAEASILLTQGLDKAIELINKFKQVAVESVDESCRKFDLRGAFQVYLVTVKKEIERSKCKVSLDIDPSLSIIGYPNALGDVFRYLLYNSLEHAFEEEQQGEINVTARMSSEEYLEIIVSDSGKGIPENELTRIFDPFFTSNLGKSGGGLGLSISYNIVKTILKGTLSVKSKLGEGSSFILSLPISSEHLNDDD